MLNLFQHLITLQKDSYFQFVLLSVRAVLSSITENKIYFVRRQLAKQAEMREQDKNELNVKKRFPFLWEIHMIKFFRHNLNCHCERSVAIFLIENINQQITTTFSKSLVMTTKIDSY